MGTVVKGHPLELFTLDCSSTHNNKLQVFTENSNDYNFSWDLLRLALTPDSFFIRVNVFVLSVLSQQSFECHCSLIHVFLAYLWLRNHNWFFFSDYVSSCYLDLPIFENRWWWYYVSITITENLSKCSEKELKCGME